MKDKGEKNWQETSFLKMNLRFNGTFYIFQRDGFKPYILSLFPNLGSTGSKISHIPYAAASNVLTRHS